LQRLDFELSEDHKATARKAAEDFDAVASSCDLKILQTQVGLFLAHAALLM
jgi:hypothetical protein